MGGFKNPGGALGGGLAVTGNYPGKARSPDELRADVAADLRVPILGNYLFSALAGTTWCFQFFFYSMGETQMGKYNFASWTLHMASIIIGYGTHLKSQH